MLHSELAPLAIWLLLTITLIYLHYTTLLFSAVQLVALIYRIALVMKKSTQPKKAKYSFRSICAFGGILVLAMSPAMWHLFALRHRTQLWSSFGGSDALADQLASPLLAYGIFLTIAVIPVAMFATKKSADSAGAQTTRVLLALLIVPIALAGCLSYRWRNVDGEWIPLAGLGHIRYVLSSYATLPLVVAASWSWLWHGFPKSKFGEFACLGLYMLMFATTVFQASDIPLSLRHGSMPILRKENWRHVGRQIEQFDGPVFFCSDIIEDELLAIHQPNRVDFHSTMIGARKTKGKNHRLRTCPEITSPNVTLPLAGGSQVHERGGFLVFQNLEVISGQVLNDYCRFPATNRFTSAKLSKKETLIPLPTHIHPRFSGSDLKLIRQSGQALIVVRGSDELIDEVLFEVKNLFEQGKVKTEVNQYPAQNRVVTIHVGLVASENGQNETVEH